MLFGTIVQEMFAAFGCFVFTILLLAVGAVLAAARLGLAPAVAKLLFRPKETPRGKPADLD